MSYIGKNPKFTSLILGGTSLATEPSPAAGNFKLIAVSGVLYVKNPSGTETAVVDLTSTQTLSSKTFSDPITLQEQGSTPSNPSSGFHKLYKKNNGRLYTLDSSGIESEVGSGAGGGVVNPITNSDGDAVLDQGQTDDVGDWIDTGTSTVSSITTTTSDIPLYPLKDTAIKITIGSTGTNYTRVRFRVPQSFRNMKLGLSWIQAIGSTYASGDMKAELYNYSDNYVTSEAEVVLSSDDSSGNTLLPAFEGTYNTSFDANEREYYELRFIRVANGGAATDWVAFNSVSVGIGSVASGVILNDWEAFTPTGSWVTNTTYAGFKRRVGTDLELLYRIDVTGAPTAANLTLNIPDALTIDTSKLSGTNPSISRLRGVGSLKDASGSAYAVIPTYNNTTSIICRSFATSGTYATTVGVSDTSPFTFASGDYIDLYVTVPIADWTGSGTTNYGAGTVEYASNSGMGNTDDTSSFVYGPSGSPLPSTTYTASRRKRVSFPTPIQPTDILEVQIDFDGSGVWHPVNGSNQVIGGTDTVQGYWNGSAGWGAVETVSDIAADVVFGTNRIASSAWSATTGTAKWRVVKHKSGIPVGFGLATATQSGLAPLGIFNEGESEVINLQNRSTTPSNPAASDDGKIYIKGTNLVIQFNDAGTVRYKYLDLSGTGVTWVHTTTAP